MHSPIDLACFMRPWRKPRWCTCTRFVLVYSVVSFEDTSQFTVDISDCIGINLIHNLWYNIIWWIFWTFVQQRLKWGNGTVVQGPPLGLQVWKIWSCYLWRFQSKGGQFEVQLFWHVVKVQALLSNVPLTTSCRLAIFTSPASDFRLYRGYIATV